MKKYEYKILRGRPGGTLLMPWASEEVKKKIGLGSFENHLNELSDDGWEVVNLSTVSCGNFMSMLDMAVVFLRKEKT